MFTLPNWSTAEARAYLTEHALSDEEQAILDAIYAMLASRWSDETTSPFQIAAAFVTDMLVLAMAPHLLDQVEAMAEQHVLAETHLHYLVWAKLLCAREEKLAALHGDEAAP